MNQRERRAILRRYRERPDLFAEEVLGVHLWSKQREVLLSVRDNPRTAVRSCHGVGKTFVAAVVVLWFLYCYPRSRVVTTAPIFDQVKLLLWAEIRTLHANAVAPLGGAPNLTSIELGEGWFAVGLSTNRPERFQGHHAEHMLFVADEASGISREIYEAAEGFLTADTSRALLIGNPNTPSGEFYEAFTKQAARWSTVHIKAMDCPTFTEEEVAKFPQLAAWMRERGIACSTEQVPDVLLRRLVSVRWVADKLAAWTDQHIAWMVRVMGEFPTQATDTVMGLQLVQDAQARSVEPDADDVRCVAVDVARYGDDETVIGLREGLRYRQLRVFGKRNTTYTAQQVLEVIEEYDRGHPLTPIQYVIVDDSGVGGGVTDQLDAVDDELDVRTFNGGERAQLKKKYPNARSEAWWIFAESYATEADLDPDPQLLADLTAAKWKPNAKLQRVVEPKEQTKKRLGRSPDRADTVLMAYYPAKRRRVQSAPALYR